jgi:DDE superfamily endonuclease
MLTFMVGFHLFMLQINFWGVGQALPEQAFFMSVDGTHCRINEPRKTPSAKWYSHKFKGPGLTYEIGVGLFESKIVWINGPFPAGESDLHVYQKMGGLKYNIPENKWVIADNGYQGEATISAPNPLDTDAVKLFKKRARARHETINSRVKNFAILEQRFRHAINKHHVVFEAVAVIIQYEMDNGYKLFDIL